MPPKIKPEQLLDKLTRSDDLLAEMIPLLERINAGEITVQMPQGALGEEMLQKMLEMQHQRMLDDYQILFFSYPADGTRATLPVGTTVLDYWAGTINVPGAAIAQMTTNLDAQNKDFLRSVAINADEGIVIQLDEKDRAPVKADTWFIMTFQQFQKLRVTCTKQTRFFCFACTNPKHAIQMAGETTVSIGREERNQIRTDKDTNFSGAIAQNAIEEENIAGLVCNEITITGVSIIADENKSFRLWIFQTDDFQEADLDDDNFVEFLDFDLAADGVQIGGVGAYYYALSGLKIDYQDLDATGELHLALQNLSAVAKTAGAGGEVVFNVAYTPRT